jgi:hypothetical protein
MKDLLGFSDLGRLLQQTTSENTTTNSSASEVFSIALACLFLIPMLVIAIFGCIRIREMRENVVDVPELPKKSTLAERKRAILELFETSEVTMVSHDQTWIAKGIRINNPRKISESSPCLSDQMVTKDDILTGAEDACIEDIESVFDEEKGILKLSRPVHTSSNPTAPDASSPLPPPSELSVVDVDVDVPNMCAICLDSYQPGQVVAWSSSGYCSHAFHQDCITHYLAKKMLGGETPCPSCRQKFCDLPIKLLKPSSLPLPSTMIAGNSATTTSASSGEEASGQASV